MDTTLSAPPPGAAPPSAARPVIDQAVARAKASPDPAAAFGREVAGIQARELRVDTRYAELGLKACAGRNA
jgi:hypothetical protein